MFCSFVDDSKLAVKKMSPVLYKHLTRSIILF